LRTALRSRLALALPVMAAVVLLAGCSSNDSNKKSSAKKKHGSVELLYVANGKSGTVTPSGGKGRYKLTLNGVGHQVIAFADRPRRDTLNMKTKDFFSQWSSVFAKDPPNAAVDLLAAGKGSTFVFELSNPQYSGSRVTFDARKLGRATGGLSHYQRQLANNLPSRFGEASLFIDRAASATWHPFHTIINAYGGKRTEKQTPTRCYPYDTTPYGGVKDGSCGGPASGTPPWNGQFGAFAWAGGTKTVTVSVPAYTTSQNGLLRGSSPDRSSGAFYVTGGYVYPWGATDVMTGTDPAKEGKEGGPLHVNVQFHPGTPVVYQGYSMELTGFLLY
jgi:hypothetical protein